MNMNVVFFIIMLFLLYGCFMFVGGGACIWDHSGQRLELSQVPSGLMFGDVLGSGLGICWVESCNVFDLRIGLTRFLELFESVLCSFAGVNAADGKISNHTRLIHSL